MKMTRFGGCAYWDGLAWRCPDCNGLTRFEQSAGEVGVDVCRTCGHHGSRLAALTARYRQVTAKP